MCDPLSIAGAVATVAGTGMQYLGSQKAQGAQDRVVAAEQQRQEQFRREQAAVQDGAVTGQTRPEQDRKLAEAEGKRTATAQAAVMPSSVSEIPLAGNEASVVGDTIANRYAASADKARTEAGSRAKLGAWGDLNFGNLMDLTKSGQTQSMLGGFSRGSSGVVPIELEAASQAGGGFNTFGQLLGGLGKVSGAAGAFGLNPFRSAPWARGGGGASP